MKYILMIIIVFSFGLIGFHKKQKIKNKNKLIQLMIDYVNFYDANLSVFKNDLFEINNTFIITQKNKSANTSDLIIKNDNLFKINNELLQRYFRKDNELAVLLGYFQTIGKSEYNEEKTKNIEIKNVFDKMLKRTTEEIKTKGEMTVKLLLSVGAVIAILLW